MLKSFLPLTKFGIDFRCSRKRRLCTEMRQSLIDGIHFFFQNHLSVSENFANDLIWQYARATDYRNQISKTTYSCFLFL